MIERMKPSEIQQYITDMTVLAEQQGASAIAAIIEDMTSSPAAGSLKRLNKSVYGPDVLEDITKLSILEKIYMELIEDQASTAARNAAASAASAASAAAVIPDVIGDDNALDLIRVAEKTTGTHNGVSFTWQTNGDCVVKRESASESNSANNIYYSTTELPDNIKPGQKYLVKFSRTQTAGSDLRLNVQAYDSQGRTTGAGYYQGDGTYTVPNNAVGILIRIFALPEYTGQDTVTAKILTAETNGWLETNIRSLLSDVSDISDFLDKKVLARYTQDTPTSGSVDDITKVGYYWIGSGSAITGYPCKPGWLIVFNYSETATTLCQIAIPQYSDSGTIVPLVRFRDITGTFTDFTAFSSRSAGIQGAVEDAEDYVLTNFQELAYWWGEDGLNTSGNPDLAVHTELIPVKPGQVLYTFGEPGSKYRGAYFNRARKWIAPMVYPFSEEAGVGIEKYTYPHANVAINNSMLYAAMYKITIPDNVYYASFNLRTRANATYGGCQSVSTMPIAAATNSGNYVWRYGDAKRARKRDKKLYLIGQSSTGIDRALRPIYDYKTQSGKGTQPIIGYQEYLIPYYKQVVSLGFAGVSYIYDEQSENASAYEQIVNKRYTGATDNNLADADEVVVFVGTNGVDGDTIGDVTDTTTTTLCGAINSLLDHIFTINSVSYTPGEGEAAWTKHPVTVYLGTYDDKRPPDNTGWDVIRQANAKIREIAAARRIPLIDSEMESGVNFRNVQFLNYDTDSNLYYGYGMHYNNDGNRIVGQYLVEKLIG